MCLVSFMFLPLPVLADSPSPPYSTWTRPDPSSDPCRDCFSVVLLCDPLVVLHFSCSMCKCTAISPPAWPAPSALLARVCWNFYLSRACLRSSCIFCALVPPSPHLHVLVSPFLFIPSVHTCRQSDPFSPNPSPSHTLSDMSLCIFVYTHPPVRTPCPVRS